MKVRRISSFQKQITFERFDNVYEQYLSSFAKTELGKIHTAIPWDKLVAYLNLRPNTKGPQGIFSTRGKLALMFLKHYDGGSDEKLMEQLNGNIYYQIFCDLLLEPGQLLENFKIISAIRCELSPLINIEELEQILMDKWRPYLDNLESVTCDATCYESNIRYPTDIKLLWESVDWSYWQIVEISKNLGLRRPRTKYRKWSGRYISYSKMRRKTFKKRRSLTRGLLRLLDKLVGILNKLKNQGQCFNSRQLERWQTIQEVLKQQGPKFYDGIRPSQAIVSLDKPYIRPIVRGKEKKPVEFGAKVHKLQIDGISFIEHLSFEAFNEGTRVKQTLYKAKNLTHKKVKLFGADAIYATNKNRKELSQQNIVTDFKIKGRKGRHYKHQTQIAKMITKERASRLEGSFGTDNYRVHTYCNK